MYFSFPAAVLPSYKQVGLGVEGVEDPCSTSELAVLESQVAVYQLGSESLRTGTFD